MRKATFYVLIRHLLQGVLPSFTKWDVSVDHVRQFITFHDKTFVFNFLADAESVNFCNFPDFLSSLHHLAHGGLAVGGGVHHDVQSLLQTAELNAVG